MNLRRFSKLETSPQDGYHHIFALSNLIYSTPELDFEIITVTIDDGVVYASGPRIDEALDDEDEIIYGDWVYHIPLKVNQFGFVEVPYELD